MAEYEIDGVTYASQEAFEQALAQIQESQDTALLNKKSVTTQALLKVFDFLAANGLPLTDEEYDALDIGFHNKWTDDSGTTPADGKWYRLTNPNFTRHAQDPLMPLAQAIAEGIEIG